MSGQFPILLTTSGRIGHEIIMLDDIRHACFDDLLEDVCRKLSFSPNTRDPWNLRFKNDKIKEVAVYWMHHYDQEVKMWPERTFITYENWRAILPMLRLRQGRDIMEVHFSEGFDDASLCG